VSGCEIVVAEQNVKEGFKLGQMRNLGFKKSKGDIIVFIDVDMRFKEKMDFKTLLKDKKEPFVAWRIIAQVEEKPIGNFKKISEGKISFGEGGCIVLSRKQFEGSHGYSNLMIGWGKEDHLLCYRLHKYRFTKLDVEMYHVFHHKGRQTWGVDPKALDHNMAMLISDRKRDRPQDSYVQTIADEKLVKSEGIVSHYLFSNVRVPDNFAYMDLYNKTESFHLKK
jgi:predicted glycosyltransferase involved in capsule biosynthesis